MVFSSVSFLVFFLPCLLVLYFMVPRRYRGARNFILLAFSLAFYACGGPKFLLLMLLSIVVNMYRPDESVSDAVKESGLDSIIQLALDTALD